MTAKIICFGEIIKFAIILLPMSMLIYFKVLEINTFVKISFLFLGIYDRYPLHRKKKTFGI